MKSVLKAKTSNRGIMPTAFLKLCIKIIAAPVNLGLPKIRGACFINIKITKNPIITNLCGAFLLIQ